MISKKKKGLRRNLKAFSGRKQAISKIKIKKKSSSPKSEGFFWPKLQVLTFFRPKNINFFIPKNTVGKARNKLGGQKRKLGGIAPSAPSLATRLIVTINVFEALFSIFFASYCTTCCLCSFLEHYSSYSTTCYDTTIQPSN